MRLSVTSDLHFHHRGHPTSAAAIEALIDRIAADTPDAVVIAGDVAHGLPSFETCVGMFKRVEAPVLVLAGNHDLWVDGETKTSTEALWAHALQDATIRQGGVWLEKEICVIGGVAIVGSLAWYDYSAIDPQFAMPEAELVVAKRFLNNDSVRMDWQRTDPAFARELAAGLCSRVAQAATQAEHIAVITHVPVLEAQMMRKPGNRDWGTANAFFGHLTLGAQLLAEPKIVAIVSGHTHAGCAAQVGHRDVRVVGSDYGVPVHVTLEIA